jgi:hypothetical protein
MRHIPFLPTDVLPGQQHMAINAAPELFLRRVLEFLAE